MFRFSIRWIFFATSIFFLSPIFADSTSPAQWENYGTIIHNMPAPKKTILPRRSHYIKHEHWKNYASWLDGVDSEKAPTQLPPPPPKPVFVRHWQFVASLGAGANRMINTVGSIQSLPIVDSQFFKYAANSDALTTMFVYDIMAGFETRLSKNILDVGLEYSALNEMPVSGTLTQGVDVQSQSQYQFNYDIKARALWLVAKYLMPNHKNPLCPYLEMGMGPSFNESSGFSTTVPPFITFTRAFENNTAVNFSYMLGAGLDFTVSPHVRVGFGYRFVDFGGASFGDSNIIGTSVPGTLSQNNLFANELLGQLTYRM